MPTRCLVLRLLALASLPVLACSARPGDDPKLQAEAERCSTTLPDIVPTSEPPIDDPESLSNIVIEAKVSKTRLSREIETRVPLVLAEEKNRPIGTPGRVSYVVKRGALVPSLHGGKLRVTTTAQANISVCKPLGPLCVGYGSCQPVFVSTVDVPLLLQNDYAWQRPSAGVQVTRGCRIAGYDATPRLKSLAESNLGALKNRVANSLPAIKPGLEQAWKLLGMPVYLNKDWCLQLTPRALTQGVPKQQGEHFHLSAALQADLTVRQNCDVTAEVADLPPLASSGDLPETGTVHLTQSLGTEALNRQLQGALEGEVVGREKITKIEARPVRVDGEDVLLLSLSLEGTTCGNAWFVAHPEAAEADRLRLTGVTPLTKAPSNSLDALARHVERVATLKPEFSFAAARNEIENLVGALSEGLTGEAALELKLGAPKASPADVVPDGLQLTSALEISAIARLD